MKQLHAIYTMQDYLAAFEPSKKEYNTGYRTLTINFEEDYQIQPYRVKLVHETETGISRMNMDLYLKPQKGENSAFYRGNVLRTLYNSKDLNDSEEYGNYGREIYDFIISVENYAGYRVREKDEAGNYGSDLISMPAGQYYDKNSGIDPNSANAHDYFRNDNTGSPNDYTEYRGYLYNTPPVPYGTTDDSGKPVNSDSDSGVIPVESVDYGDDCNYQNVRILTARDTATAMQKNAGAEKFANAVNNIEKSRVDITYTLSGHEGYVIDDKYRNIIQDISLLENAINNSSSDIKIYSPEREYVYFYDLLPIGVQYDASVTPTVGRLKVPTVQQAGNNVDTFVSQYWDTDVAEIVPYDSNSTALASIVSNWNNTGRNLVRFKIKLNNHIEGKEYNYNYDPNSKNWFYGCGIRFSTYVKWENYAAAQATDNLCSYVVSSVGTDENGNIVLDKYSPDLIGDRGTQIFYDDPDEDIYGNIPDEYKSGFQSIDSYVVTDFDKDGNLAEYNRAYASRNNLSILPTSTQADVTKSVRADRNTAGEFSPETGVIVGEDYTYRIGINVSSPTGAIKDLVIYDAIEKLADGEKAGQNGNLKDKYWQGTLKSIDISILKTFLKQCGVSDNDINNNLKIYYTTDNNPEPPVKYTGEGENKKYEKLYTVDEIGVNWNEVTSSTNFGTITGRVSAIAVIYRGELRKSNNDSIAQLKSSIDIKMKAPISMDAANSQEPYAKNRAWFYLDSNDLEPGYSSWTVVTIGEKMKLIVTKQLGDSVPDELKDEEFTFRIKAAVGKYKNNTVEYENEAFTGVYYSLWQRDGIISESEYEDLTAKEKEESYTI